jgi:hypothetical protein
MNISTKESSQMKQMKETVVNVLCIGLIAAGTAFSSPCCMDKSKECTAKKQCVSPKKECPVKKNCAATNTSDNMKNTVPDRTILFFMNPNGHPCQMQLSIIEGMKDKLTPLANVTYIKTTESGDREKFSQYGIRGLPSLIIIDKNGKEITRFQPGIQDEETILSSLQQKTR